MIPKERRKEREKEKTIIQTRRTYREGELREL